MKTEEKLKKLFSLILKEVQSNPELAVEIEQLLGEAKPVPGADTARSHPARHRRKEAQFDPFTIHPDREAELRIRLAELEIEQLKDIVAQYGMDPAKLVLKWKSKDRLIEHIITTVRSRLKKGDAFRN